MSLMEWKESRKVVEETIDIFIADFLKDNSSRCLDDLEDCEAVGAYLRDKIPTLATDLTRAALGLRK
jgi:hypothetical protein